MAPEKATQGVTMGKARGNKSIKFLVSIAVCQLAGFIGSRFTTPAIPTWYATLEKPLFTPPSWVFAPVWITLFLLMGVSLFFVWREGVQSRQAKTALILFAVQWVLNVLWSFLFFGLKSPVAGFLEIGFLWIAILLTILAFYRISRIAGFLLVPYMVWVGFAFVLNAFFMILNR